MRSLVSAVLLAALGAAALGMVACGPPATWAFDGHGYKHQTYGYRLLNQGQGSLLSSEWELDNLYETPTKKLEQKHSPDYVATYSFDMDGDGETDRREQGFLYDLRFKHKHRDALIWLRTLPISADLREKDLRVLVQRYIDEVSGAGFEAVQLTRGSIVIREKRYAANVISRGSFTVAKHEAFESTFDVANVDEVQINPNARKTRVRIALIRTPFNYPKRQLDKVEFPVLMLVGYANLPEDFAKDEPAFDSILSHIQSAQTLASPLSSSSRRSPPPLRARPQQLRHRQPRHSLRSPRRRSRHRRLLRCPSRPHHLIPPPRRRPRQRAHPQPRQHRSPRHLESKAMEIEAHHGTCTAMIS